MYRHIYIYIEREREERYVELPQRLISGPEAVKRKRETRKADGKLTLLVNLGGTWHEKPTLLVTHFSLPSLADPFQGRRPE